MPTLYGFIPQTFCGREVADLCEKEQGARGRRRQRSDGHLCLVEKAFLHGSFFLHARIGGLRMIDGQQADDKIVAVLESDLAFGRMENPRHTGGISRQVETLLPQR